MAFRLSNLFSARVTGEIHWWKMSLHLVEMTAVHKFSSTAISMDRVASESSIKKLINLNKKLDVDRTEENLTRNSGQHSVTTEMKTKKTVHQKLDKIIEDRGKKKKLKITRVNALNQTIDIFRNFPEKYPFILLSPPQQANNRNTSDPAQEHMTKLFWLRFATRTNDKEDLLDAWKLVSQDTLRCTTDLETRILDQFLQRLCEKFPEMSYAELTSALFHLSFFMDDHGHLKLLSTLLDQQLASTLRVKLSKKSVNSEDINECLKVSFVWVKHGMVAQNRRRTGVHNSLLVQMLLDDHIDQLTPQQLSFVLFLCGVQRHLPGCRPDNITGQGYPLPGHVNDKLVSILPFLSNLEVGVVCHALHQTHIYLETEHVAVRSSIISHLLHFPTLDIMRHEFTISCLAKFLKKRGSEHYSDVMEVIKKYRPHLNSLGVYTKLRLLQFILPGKPTNIKEFLTDFCNSIVDDLDTMRLKDLEMLAFCLFFLGSDDEAFYKQISSTIQHCQMDANVRSGRSFVYLTSHLAKAGVFNFDNMDAIFLEANKCDMTDLDSDRGLANAVDFLFRLNLPALSNKRKVSEVLPFLRANRVLCRNAIFQVMELDCLRELHDLQTKHRFREDSRKLVADYFQRETGEIQTSDGRISAQDFGDQSRKFVCRDLMIILGGEEFVHFGHAFGHSTYKDLFFAVDNTGAPKIIKNWAEPGGTIIRRRKEEGIRALVVPPKNVVGFLGEPLGPLTYKLKQLSLLGYCPIVIHWVDYYRALRERKNLTFLRRKLNIRKIK